MSDALKVLCAGAVKSAITLLAPQFERDAGRAVHFTFGTAEGLLKDVEAGAQADVLVLARPALEKAMQGGRALRETAVDLGRVGVGLAVRSGAPAPDVTSREALRAALVAAKSLTYGDPAKGDSSGIHFAKVLEQLGVADVVRGRTVLAPVGLAVAELVASGEVELGATQASVILAREGVQLAGMLPPDLQHVTTYSAAVMANAASIDDAKRFVAALATPAAKASFARAGFD